MNLFLVDLHYYFIFRLYVLFLSVNTSDTYIFVSTKTFCHKFLFQIIIAIVKVHIILVLMLKMFWVGCYPEQFQH